MSSQRNQIKAGVRSRGGSEVYTVTMKAFESEEDKLQQPCFECYLRGAWWEVDILERRSEKLLVRYIHLTEKEDSWLSLDRLRLRARKCDDWDCLILRSGVDVSVYALHPKAELLNFPTTLALYDAKIISVAKSRHEPECCCKFFVHFFCIKDESFSKHGVERSLLDDVPVKEVSITKLSILQQPGKVPLHEILKAHISGKWNSEQGRWSHDAVFLRETELRISPNARGEESMTVIQGDVPADMPGPKYRLRLSKTKATRSCVRETSRLGSKFAVGIGEFHPHSKETAEVDYRGKKPYATKMKYLQLGVKRKSDSVDEKEIKNLVLEDHSPGVSSRFTISNGNINDGPRRKDQKVDYAGATKFDNTHYNQGKVMEMKRGRKLIVESESSSEGSLSERSEERLVDSNENSESNGDFFLKRGRSEEERHVGSKQHKHNYDSLAVRGTLPRAWRSGGYGIKPEQFLNKNGGRWQAIEKNQLRSHQHKAGKGSSSAPDSQQGKLESKSVEETPERKRGRPKGSTGLSKAIGGNELEDTESPTSIKNCSSNFKQSVKNEVEANRIRIANLGSTHKVKALIGSEQNESDCCGSKKIFKGVQDENFQLVKRLTVNGSSSRQQMISGGKGAFGKEPQKNHEEDENDPALPKKYPHFSTSGQNLERLANDPSLQLRKLRPRAGKLRKALLRNQTHVSSNISKCSQKGAGKEKGGAEKVADRPLYMDLLVNNWKGEADGEKPVEVGAHVEEPKADFGLNDTWDPIAEETLSDSDCKMLSEEDPLMRKVCQEFNLGETSAAVEKVLTSVLQDDVQAEKCISKGETKEGECGHNFSLKDDVGLVCDDCGVVSIPIEEMIPEVDCSRHRLREVDFDEWDIDKRSSDLNRLGTGYDILEGGKEVTMLNTCLPPHYAHVMHPHQKDGFEFLWRNLSYREGELRKRKVDKNAGCILSHAPGTGKSFLIISFLKSYMDRFPGCQPLIVAPKIMLLGWEKEFTRWKSDIKVFILNTARVTGKRLMQKHEESGIIKLKNHQMSPRAMVDTCRMAMLYEWRNRRSVCLVSYNLFSSLTEEGALNRTQDGEGVRKSLLESPGILILDEGHFPRNKDTRIRKALMRVKTNSRILLSGTLFQNNFEELFNTLYLVRPGFVEAFSSCKLGESSHLLLDESEEKPANYLLDMEEVTGAAEKKARKLFVEEVGMKIEQGQLCKGSEVLQHGLQRLQRLTADFVHHYAGEVLASLPGLRDFGILLKPTALQCTLLELVEKVFQKPEESLKREIAVSEASIHPSLLAGLEFVKDLHNEPKVGNWAVPQCERLAMLKQISLVKDFKDPEDGVKTKFVFDLLCSLKSTEEKVLIFSQHISPLKLLENMFTASFNWDKKKDVLKLDGNLAMGERQVLIEQFNDPQSDARVLLASTKACGEGITLVGASRVVFLDVLWNPAVIKQAVSRAFRLGQKKTVYVYRLIASGTIEEKKYKKAIRKDWLSKAIFCPAAGESGSYLDRCEVTGKESEKTQLSSGLAKLSPTEESLAWEIDATTCEDDLLDKLLRIDKIRANSFSKVVEHSSGFHNRKTCGSDARDWFLEDWEDKDLSHVKERREGEERGTENTDPENVAAKLYQDFGESGAFGVGDAPSSSDTDEEDL